MSLEVKHVWYTYQEGSPNASSALQDINLTVNEGEFLGIVGHTGSGKSTLIQHLNGLLKPTQGQVIVDGIDLHAKESKSRLKQIRVQVGIVFQYPEYQLFEETIEKDIAFGPANLGFTAQETKQRVKWAMELLGLDYQTLHKQSPFDLSGGQKRKVAIAGVLAMQPKYLILDEPAAGLDPKGREEFLEQVRTLHKKGMTVIMVSHSMDDVARYAQRMIVLYQGRIRLEGKPEDVFKEYALLEELGVGVPTVTKLLHRLREQGMDVNPDLIRLEDVKNEILRVMQQRRNKKLAGEREGIPHA